MLVSFKSVAPQDTNLAIQGTVPLKGVNGVNPEEISGVTVIMSPENLKRRDFFLELSSQLAKGIYARNPEDNSKTFSKGGYNFDQLRDLDKRGFNLFNRRSTENQSIPEGVKNFADRVATGLVYQYQDHVPILTKESCARLTNYFVNSTLYYAYSRFQSTDYKPFAASGTYDFESSTVYDMLMHKIIQPQISNEPLKTENGFNFSINHLMSTGFRTLNDQSYIPSTPENVHDLFLQLKKQENFPLYRYGTYQTLEYMYKNVEGREEEPCCFTRRPPPLQQKDITFISEAEASISKGENQGAFWRKAEALAQQYLTSAEYNTLTNSF